ncbi:MAG: hypothetical protein OQK05_00065 [Pseudopelagicola sp.]|nr:hypothetical protein [Pseudopelagicola sp.]
MSAKQHIGNILFLAEVFGQGRSLSRKTVSLYAAGRGGYFDDLKSGKLGSRFGISEERQVKIFQWFSDNWPPDLEWPDHIDRPDPMKEHAA